LKHCKAMQSGYSMLRLQQLVAVGSRQAAAVDGLEAIHDLDRFLREGRFAFKTVQDNALQKVSERQLTVLCEALQDFEEGFGRRSGSSGSDVLAWWLR